jgi:3-hydroxybutyryl-CoA dehydrogenase
MVVEEGVAEPQEIDEMWRIFVRSGRSPFEAMDHVGLDVVLAIEEHYAAIRPGLPAGPRNSYRTRSIGGGSPPKLGAASTTMPLRPSTNSSRRNRGPGLA